MQVLDHVFKIEDSSKKDNILEIVADKYCRAILDTTMYKPKSVMEIAIDAKIPLSTVYRRLQSLEEQKLLWTSEGKLMKKARGCSYTKARLKESNAISTEDK
ncbi:MAG: winged helix-turn-helix domain-containing protein [Nitrosopumilus sp.]